MFSKYKYQFLVLNRLFSYLVSVCLCFHFYHLCSMTTNQDVTSLLTRKTKPNTKLYVVIGLLLHLFEQNSLLARTETVVETYDYVFIKNSSATIAEYLKRTFCFTFISELGDLIAKRLLLDIVQLHVHVISKKQTLRIPTFCSGAT